MALSFSSAPGNVFNVLGKCSLLLKQLRSYQNSQKTNLIDATNGLIAQFPSEPDLQGIVGQGYMGSLNAPGQIGSLAQAMARAEIDRAVYRDSPRQNQTLTSPQVLASVVEVIRQMKAAGASVLAMPVTAVPTSTNNPGPHFAGAGTGAIVASTRRPSDGLTLENAFSETILFTCTADSYLSGATAGNEGFVAVGKGLQNNLFAFDWPLGSNCRTSLTSIDGNQNNTGGNLLNNSGFASFTANVPNNWVLEVGTAGTHILQETSLVYDVGSAVRFVGDGSTPTSLTQTFNNSTLGTSGTLSALTQYGVNLFLRRDGTAAGAGTLTMDLVDGNNVVINDQGGTPNSFNVDLTALTTSYAPYNGAFRTPLVLPSVMKLRIRQSVALTNNRSIYLDKCSFGTMSQLGKNLCYASIHAGNVPFQVRDLGQMVITNSRGSGGTLDTFQTALYRLVPEIGQNELLIPSNSVPTISDAALIA